MNSDVRDYRGGGGRTDHLQEQEWLESFAARGGFGAPGPATDDDLAKLTALRSAMWRVVGRIVEGAEPDPADVAAIDDALARVALHRRLERSVSAYRLALRPQVSGWPWIASEVAASFAELLATIDRQRLKVCGNPDCRWVFYDESRNRSRRWCADSCGNLLKVRRFRRRQER